MAHACRTVTVQHTAAGLVLCRVSGCCSGPSSSINVTRDRANDCALTEHAVDSVHVMQCPFVVLAAHLRGRVLILVVGGTKNSLVEVSLEFVAFKRQDATACLEICARPQQVVSTAGAVEVRIGLAHMASIARP